MSPKEKDTKAKKNPVKKQEDKISETNDAKIGLDAEIQEVGAEISSEIEDKEEAPLLTADLKAEQKEHKSRTGVVATALIVGLIAGLVGGAVGGVYLVPYFSTDGRKGADKAFEQTLRVDEQSAVVDVVASAEPSVVSIVVTKDLPRVQQFFFNPFSPDGLEQFESQDSEVETQQIGAGSGFIVTSDGMIITNRHVVDDETADYTVVTSEGESYSARVLARDPLNDLAVIQIDQDNLPTIPLGDSDVVKLGSRVVAIGNALGELSNTVTSGIISGIGRAISANDGSGEIQRLDEVFQTDAAINPGNSGGPLLNLAGQVIGVNTAIDRSGQLIGFAIPANEVKKVLEDVIEHGRILRPYIGIRYVILTEVYAENNNLPYSQGALLISGDTIAEPAVQPDSPAEEAGLQEGDIITELNGKLIDTENTIVKLLKDYDPSDEIVVKFNREGEASEVIITLAERE